MHHSPVQSDRAHADFFHKQHGKRHVLGAQSSVDSILLGRDIDKSGADPHYEQMNQYSNHAGMRSGDRPQGWRPFRKPLLAMQSQVDTEVFGHEIDGSGPVPHQKNFKPFAQEHYACQQAGTTPHRPFRKPGYAMKSTMDDLIFGRDLDGSGANPHENFAQKFAGHAGVVTENREQRPFRRQNMSAQSQMDEVIYGRDMDKSGPSPQKTWMMSHYKDHAGMKSEEKVERPYRKPGISMKAVVDDVIQDHDVDASGPNVHHDHFEKNFQGHAGYISGTSQAGRNDRTSPRAQRPGGYAGKMANDPKDLRRRVGGYGGLKPTEPPPRWNCSVNTKQPPTAPSSLAEPAGSSAAGARAPEAATTMKLQRLPASARAPSDAGASEAGGSQAGGSQAEGRRLMSTSRSAGLFLAAVAE